MLRAAWVTGQRAGCPQTSPSHSRQWVWASVIVRVSAASTLAIRLLERVALGGVERVERALQRGRARGADRADRLAPVGGELEPDGAPVAAGAAPALDQAAGLEPVGEAHDGGVRQAQRLAQRRQRHPCRVVVQRDEARGLAGADVLRGGHRVAGAVADRHGEGAEEVAGTATSRRHPPHRATCPWACGRRSRRPRSASDRGGARRRRATGGRSSRSARRVPVGQAPDMTHPAEVKPWRSATAWALDCSMPTRLGTTAIRAAAWVGRAPWCCRCRPATASCR